MSTIVLRVSFKGRSTVAGLATKRAEAVDAMSAKLPGLLPTKTGLTVSLETANVVS